MAKKKKVWSTVALERSNMSEAEKIRENLVAVLGNADGDEDLEKLYDFLASQFEKIDALDSDRAALELSAQMLCGSGFFEFCDDLDEDLDENASALFGDVVSLFVERATDFSDREFVEDLLHDLLVRSQGEATQTDLFLSVKEFLSAEEVEATAEKVLSTLAANDLANEEFVFAGLLDLADGAGNPGLYEKVSFLQDPEHLNETKIRVSNAYYVAGDLANAKRLLDEVKDPAGPDEEEFLDLKIGMLFKEGKEKEALELAENLYEKFPKAYHLMSLCKVVSPKRKEELLDAHERFRLGNSASPEYINLLASLEEFERLSRYIDGCGASIRQMDGEEREALAERLDSLNHPELSKKLRRI